MLIAYDADDMHIATGLLDAPLDANDVIQAILGRDSLGVETCLCGAKSVAQACGGCVLETALDVCFCCKCVASAYTDGMDECQDYTKSVPGELAADLHGPSASLASGGSAYTDGMDECQDYTKAVPGASARAQFLYPNKRLVCL